MDKFETLLVTSVDKACGNTGRAIMKRFIKSRSSTMFVHLVYPLDEPGALIEISRPHKEFSIVILGYGWVENIFQMDDADQ